MKRKINRKKLYWILGIVVIVLVAGGFGLKTWLSKRSSSTQSVQTSKVTLGTVSTTISGSGTVRSGQSSNINWQTSGTVATVNVQIGQQVKAGDVLATLDPTSLSSSIIQAQADLIDAQTALDDLLKPQPLQIAQAQAALNTAQENLDNLLNPTALTLAKGESAVTDAQKALDVLLHPTALSIAQAESAVTDAQTALNTLLNPDPKAISEAETAVQTAQTALDDAQTAVDRLKYARSSQSAIDAARATLIVAENEVTRAQEKYDQTGGDPNQDAFKAQALTVLNTAKQKRDKALAALNWYLSAWSETEISERNNALTLAKATLADAQKTLDSLSNPSAADIALAQGRVSDAQAALDTLKNPTAVDIALAEAQVNDAQKALDKIKNPTAVDIELAKQQVANAQDTVDTLKNGASEADITVAKSRVTLAEATLAQATIAAPFDGTITNVETLPGDQVSNGTAAFRIDDLSKLYVDLSISEVDISQIQVGQKATLTFDAISNKEYNGVITKVVMAGTVSQGVVNYPVTVQLTDGDASVLSGMTSSVNLITAESANVLVVPNKAVHTSGTQRTVTVLFQGQQIQVPVTVGLVGDSYTEITGTTLKEGDVVVVSTTTGTTSSSTTTQRGFDQGGGPVINFEGGGGFPGGVP
jgi:RND family efflux transporter MFP subunit